MNNFERVLQNVINVIIYLMLKYDSLNTSILKNIRVDL